VSPQNVARSVAESVRAELDEALAFGLDASHADKLRLWARRLAFAATALDDPRFTLPEVSP
jgi:hypothetical protein